MIACVFSIDIFNVSSTLFQLCESLYWTSVCPYPSINSSMLPLQRVNRSPPRPGAQPVQMGGPNQSPLLSHALTFQCSCCHDTDILFCRRLTLFSDFFTPFAPPWLRLTLSLGFLPCLLHLFLPKAFAILLIFQMYILIFSFPFPYLHYQQPQLSFPTDHYASCHVT